ncbi:hypothetical protein J5N97_023534 [Dioscorea zingiberensis]|uniref:Uncharacterized protein n=1 Tax=Dioscorea zingiberensis TaxID=325984 RepID=A0A9D5H832_9LILI|nr:hypothetical protein J5N97_023534 [Dioscorea zingiberensis]
MASLSSHAIKVLDQSSVSPPKGSVLETSIPLSFFDLLWLQAGVVERLFFYKFPYSTSHFIHHFLPIFKSSLSLTLQHFFPLSCHIRRNPNSEHKIEYHYIEDRGCSVPFILAESEADFDALSGDHNREFKHLQPLIPSLVSLSGDTPAPLMASQVTVFPNHGLCVAISVNHSVCDGASSTNFIKSWAATCSSGSTTASLVPAPPLFDRSMLHDPNNLHSRFLRAIEEDGALIVFQDSSKTVTAAAPIDVDKVFSTFSLRPEHVEKLKNRVKDKYKEFEAMPFHCSTFVIAFAYVWTCLMRSREWQRDRTSHMAFAADYRSRLLPPLPPEYFGNCVGGCFGAMKVAELLNDDGFEKAAEVVGRAIDELKDGYVLEGAEEWPELIKKLCLEDPLSVAGSPRFRVYGTDFGWGKPVKVEIPSIRHASSMAVTESRDGVGGIEIGLALPEAEMNQFRSHFITGLR